MLTGASAADAMDIVRRAGLDRIEGVFAYEGGENLVKPGLGHRRRTRLELPDGEDHPRVLYLKRYGRTGIGDGIRRWMEHGRRASTARVEFDNIRAAREAGVPTMEAVACGDDPSLLGCGRSFLIVTAVPGDAMERCFDEYLASHDAQTVGDLTARLASMVRALHGSGYVHRDLYAAHVFLDSSTGRDDLYLIDLARMFRPRLRRRRWFVKDLAQLRYSMPPAWVEQHWEAFLAEYLGDQPVGTRRMWEKLITRKVASMRRRDRRRQARREAAQQGGGQ